MPTFKGTYDESMTAAHRRLPRGQRAAHPAGVRSGHGHHDGRQGRDQAGGEGHDRGRREVRPKGLRPGRGGLLHRPQRPDAELSVQQLDARSSTTTRTPSRPPASTPRRPRRPGPKWCSPRPSSRPAATSARSPPAGSAGPSWRASRPGTTCCSRRRTTASAAPTRGWPSTRRCTCATSRTWPTWPSRACSSTRAATTSPTSSSRRASAR